MREGQVVTLKQGQVGSDRRATGRIEVIVGLRAEAGTGLGTVYLLNGQGGVHPLAAWRLLEDYALTSHVVDRVAVPAMRAGGGYVEAVKRVNAAGGGEAVMALALSLLHPPRNPAVSAGEGNWWAVL